MEYEREEYMRLQKLLNQQNKIKDEQFLGFPLPKLQETVGDIKFQDNLTKMLNPKKTNRKRCVSQTLITRSRLRTDDSSSQALSSHHQSFSITQPLLHSRNEKRSISNVRMTKNFKDNEASNTSVRDVSQIIDQMKQQTIDRAFQKKNFNCASIGPAMSNALDKQERVLVGVPQNVVQHRLKVLDSGRGNLYEMLEDLRKVRQQRKDFTQKDEVVKKMDLLQQYGLDFQEKVALGREHYINKNEELQKRFLEDMIEMNYVLRKKRERVSTLPSSEATIEHLKRPKFEYMEEGIPSFFYKRLNLYGDSNRKDSNQSNQDQENDSQYMQTDKSTFGERRSMSQQNTKRYKNDSFMQERENETSQNLERFYKINLNLIKEEELGSSRNGNEVNTNNAELTSILKKRIVKVTDDTNRSERTNPSPIKGISFPQNLKNSNLNHQTNASFIQKNLSMRNMKSSYSRFNDEQTSTSRIRQHSAQTQNQISPQKSLNSTQVFNVTSNDKNPSFSQKVNILNRKTQISDRESYSSPNKKIIQVQSEDIQQANNRRIKTVIVTKDTGPSEEEIYDRYHDRNTTGKNVYAQMIKDQHQKKIIYISNKKKFEQMQNDMIYKPEDKDKDYENQKYRFEKSIKTAHKAIQIAKKMKFINSQADRMLERLNFK